MSSPSGIVLTRTPGDDPRANGRVEVAVKSFKTQTRRLLKQADVGSECWPLAARYADALNRSWRLGDAPSFPPFMQDVLVRRRTWRQGVFEPTVERLSSTSFLLLKNMDIGFKLKKNDQESPNTFFGKPKSQSPTEVGRNRKGSR